MRVLVTGESGFIGGWVVEEVKRAGWVPVPFGADLRDIESFPDGPFDAVVHLAALVTHREDHSLSDLYDVNVAGTGRLLDAYPEARMVFASTKDLDRAVLSDYAQTKLEGEHLVRRRSRWSIVRLPSVFGPNMRQRKLIPLLFEKYCLGGSCTVGNNDVREYVWVGDAAHAIVSAVVSEGFCEINSFRISNRDLERHVKAICEGSEPGLLPERERNFFQLLVDCRPMNEQQ
jgi:nucleoside-diphosphate-sugar epimerase